MRLLFAAIAVALMTGQAHAQDRDWQFQATGNLWLPTTRVTVDTPRGSVSGKLSISDAIDDLDFALMGSFEARRDRLSLSADLIYFDLTARQPTPFGALFDMAAVNSKITALTALAAWRVQETSNFAIDLGAGARMMWTDVDVSLTGGALPPESSGVSDDWIDPVIALRARYDFDEKWFGTLYLDAGGFGVGSEETYQAAATLGYNLNERWSLSGGWRFLSFEREKNGTTLDFEQSGAIFAATVKF